MVGRIGLAMRGCILGCPEKLPLTVSTFERPASHGVKARVVHQQIKAIRVILPAPQHPDRVLPDVEVTAILATEPQPPAGEEPVEWLLLTNLPAQTPEQALEKLERLEPALAFYLDFAWRVLFVTMLGRECPEMPCDVVFEQAEWQAVYIVTERKPPPDPTDFARVG